MGVLSAMTLCAHYSATFGSKKYSAFEIVNSSPPTVKKHALLLISDGNYSKHLDVVNLDSPT